MEVWKAIYIFVFCIGPIQTYPFERERLEREARGCRGPDMQIANGSLVACRDFPRQDYRATLNSHPDKREIEDMIRREKRELRQVIRMEKTFDVYNCYMPLCKSKSKIIEQWRVDGKNCWSIQPIIWRKCRDIPLDSFSCVYEADTEGFGFKCLPDYMQQTILVYCQEPVSPTRKMTVYASFKCSMKSYCCVDRN